VLWGTATPWDHHHFGLPVALALTDAKADESDTCLDMIAFTGLDPTGVTFIADKGYRRASYRHQHDTAAVTQIRSRLRCNAARSTVPARQTIESMNRRLNAQLDLERSSVSTQSCVATRIVQRFRALNAAICNDETTDRAGSARSPAQPTHRRARVGVRRFRIRLSREGTQVMTSRATSGARPCRWVGTRADLAHTDSPKLLARLGARRREVSEYRFNEVRPCWSAVRTATDRAVVTRT
jgi:hypothetical protein